MTYYLDKKINIGKNKWQINKSSNVQVLKIKFKITMTNLLKINLKISQVERIPRQFRQIPF